MGVGVKDECVALFLPEDQCAVFLALIAHVFTQEGLLSAVQRMSVEDIK